MWTIRYRDADGRIMLIDIEGYTPPGVTLRNNTWDITDLPIRAEYGIDPQKYQPTLRLVEYTQGDTSLPPLINQARPRPESTASWARPAVQGGGKPGENLVFTFPNGVASEEEWKIAEANSIFDAAKGELAAGVMQHPDTKLYQLWVSLTGNDFSSLAAFKTEARALEEMDVFRRLWLEGQLLKNEGLDVYLTELSSSPDYVEATPFPEQTVKEMSAELRRGQAGKQLLHHSQGRNVYRPGTARKRFPKNGRKPGND